VESSGSCAGSWSMKEWSCLKTVGMSWLPGTSGKSVVMM